MAARAAARASVFRFTVSPSSFKASISLVGVPRRVILNFGELRGRIVDSGVAGNGGFCNPGFGDMRSFWFSVGMCSKEAAAEDRS